MAQSIFSYRGGARSGSVSGQPTGLGGAPIGRAGQTFGQALRLQMQRPQQGPMVATGEQSGFATPQPKPAPTPATQAPAQGAQRMMPQPARAALGVTTPMFMPSFRLPNTAFARYMQTQMTAPQQVVQNTPVGFGRTAAQQQGVGGPQVQRVVQKDNVRARPGGGIQEQQTGTDADGNAMFRDIRDHDIIIDYNGDQWVWNKNTGQLENQGPYEQPDRITGKDADATEQELFPDKPSIGTNDDSTVTIDGLAISDPFAKTEEQLQSQRMIDEAEQRAQNINKRAQEQIDADQILKALAAAGAQGVRGGMSGFGLGEQGEILRAANAAKLQAESVLQGSLASLAAQTAANEQADFERNQSLYEMNTAAGKKAFERTQKMSDIAQQIAELQQDGLTDEETAQVQTLAQEYADLKAANDAYVADQMDDTEEYGGDLNSDNDVSDDRTLQKTLINETTEAMKDWIIRMRTPEIGGMSDWQSVENAYSTVIDLINRAKEGDRVSKRVLENLGLGELIDGPMDGGRIRDAMEEQFDHIHGHAPPIFYGDAAYRPLTPPSLDWKYRITGEAPSDSDASSSDGQSSSDGA